MTDPAAPYLPPPSACESLASIVARFGGALHAKGSVDVAQNERPLGVTEDVRELLRGSPTMWPPAEGVAVLPGGRVFGAGVVLAPDGGSIARDVSLDFGRRDEDHWLLREKKIRPAEVLPGPTTVIASALGEGYCHWLLDELPRLLLLGPAETRGRLLTHGGTPCARVALDLKGWKGEIIEPTRRGHWQCEELVVPSLTGWTGLATRRQIELLSAFTTPLHGKTNVGEKLYVSRSDARRRRVTNESEVSSVLAERGFVEVRLETLSWPQQINAFRNARVIVAPHGAGLANLVFCESGTRVVECFGRAYLNGCFWQIAALRGLDYLPLVAAGDGAPGCDPRSNRLDFAVDIAALRKALS